MKIQCSGCEAAEAKVLCCADEAALCLKCDENIHAVNMLVSKHQRVPLSSSSSPAPKCDICQETSGYFFCLEDRALLCRKCDLSIHTLNSYVSTHQRFLLTGVKAGLAVTEPSKGSSTSAAAAPTQSGKRARSYKSPLTVNSSCCVGEVEDMNLVTTHKQPLCGIESENVVEWRGNEFVSLTDSVEKSAPGRFSKEQGVCGESEWSKILRSAEEELLNDGRWPAAPCEDISWRVPQLFPVNPPVLTTCHFPGETIQLPPQGSTTAEINFNDLMPSELSCTKRKTRRR